MSIPVLAAARSLALHSGWSLTHLELQQIIYLAHMFMLGRNAQPLVYGNFEAWDYGPIHPILFDRLSGSGARPVRNIFYGVSKISDDMAQDILDEAHDALCHLGPGGLVRCSHRQGGAWAKNYVPGVRGNVISDDDLLEEYRGLPQR